MSQNDFNARDVLKTSHGDYVISVSTNWKRMA